MTRGKWQDRVKAVEQRALTYQSAPISCPYKARLSRPWQPSSVWRLFPRQKDAIAFSQRCKQVGAREERGGGLLTESVPVTDSLNESFPSFFSLFSGRPCVCSGEREHRGRTEGVFSDQLH